MMVGLEGSLEELKKSTIRIKFCRKRKTPKKPSNKGSEIKQNYEIFKDVFMISSHHTMAL